MGEPLLAAAATVIVGLLGLLGTRWLSGVQRKAAENEERLSRYESWDHLIEHHRQDADRFRTQRDEAWAESDRLRAENSRLKQELGKEA